MDSPATRLAKLAERFPPNSFEHQELMKLAAASPQDRIEALIKERDALKAENERLRETLEEIERVGSAVWHTMPQNELSVTFVTSLDDARAALKGDDT